MSLPPATRLFPVFIVALLATACQPASPAHPTSILLISVDTWRADHLDPTHSPNLYRIATEGWRFTHAWTPIGLTSPAHATLFTGQLPWQHGMRANNHHGSQLAPAAYTLAEHAHQAGWATGAFVSAWPAGPAGGLDQGFDTFQGPSAGERPGHQAVGEALRWLDSLPSSQPYLLWVHLYEPHGPYAPPRDDLLAVGAPAEGASDRLRYGGEVHQADRLLQPLLQRWRDSSALLLVAGDHGEVLDEQPCGVQHERSTHEVVLRVPLFLAGPGLSPRVIEEWVGLDDVAATLAGQVPLPPWPGGRGRDLAAAHDPRTIWLAESGLCEADCAPGCRPEGLLGRDRVVIGEEWRVTFRPGRGMMKEGAVPADAVWREALGSLPVMTLPLGAEDGEMGRALGYLE